MATFNILGFNQEKTMAVQQEKQINLNGNDLIVLRNIVDMIDSNRLETKDIDNKKYTWIKYSLLVENLIFVSDKEDTFKKIITKLIKCELLERKVLKSVGNGAYTYFRKTDLLKDIEYVAESSDTKTSTKKTKKRKSTKKDQTEKVEVLEGQVTVEEALEQTPVKQIDEVIKEATGADDETIEKAIEYAIYKDAEKPIGFAIKAIKEGWDMRILENKSNVVNPLGFNNFEAREYDYDALERKLLGWE